MAKDRQLSVRMMAEQTGLDENAAHRILTDHLKNLCKTSAKKLLCEQKTNQSEICQDLLGKTRN